MFQWCVVLFVVVSQFLHGICLEAYIKPEGLSDAEWEEVLPMLLPEDHPIKKKLDKLFGKGRWTESQKTLKKGEFSYAKHDAWDNVYIARHSKLKGYVLKLYTDDQVGVDDRGLLIQRVRGAGFIRSIIEAHNYGDLFDVPQKWLYPLPDIAFAPNLQRKHFILIAEDMKLINAEMNREHWKSSKISHELLDGLFTVLKEAGLLDSVYIDNIPFSMYGKVVFIDTEHYQKWPVPYYRLTKKFSKSNQVYWQSLIDRG